MQKGGLQFLLRVNAACGGRRGGEFLAGLGELLRGVTTKALQLGQLPLVKTTVRIMCERVNDLADGIVEDHLDLLDAAPLRGTTGGLGEDRLPACHLQQVQLGDLLFYFLLDCELPGAAAGEHPAVLLDSEGLQDELCVYACGDEVFLELLQSHRAPLLQHAFYYKIIIGINIIGEAKGKTKSG